jgi:predicted nucleotidyltransferase
MPVVETTSISDIFREDIERAIQILKEEGCTEIHLFGSVATGETRAESDIDLAVRGCPPGRFFHTLGRLMMALDHSVDLVDLDSDDPFAEFLQQKRRLLRIWNQSGLRQKQNSANLSTT